MHRTAVIFDIDGTLLTDGGAAGIAFARAFEELFGMFPKWSAVEKAGRTDFAIFNDIAEHSLQRIPDDVEREALYGRYAEYLDEALRESSQFRVFPGVVELLLTLQRIENIGIGIQTGNAERAARAKLRRAGIEDHFAFGGFCCRSANRLDLMRIAVDSALARGATADSIFVVGDTPHDLRGAAELGVHAVGVATGSFTVQQLNEAPALRVLPDLSDTSGFLDLVGA